MGRKASHHFIPVTYLSEFTKEEKRNSTFWSVPNNNSKPFVTSPIKTCKKRDYYTIDHQNSLMVEDWYANEIEPKIKSALESVRQNKTLPAREDRDSLLLLVATLYIRTPSNRERIEAPLRIERDMVQSMSEDINILNKKDFEYSQTDLIKMELKILNMVMDNLSKKYYRLFYIKDENIDFITSDDPFHLTHPYAHKKGFYYGLGTPNTMLSIPVNRKTILVGINEEVVEGTYVANKELVGEVNTNTVLQSSNFFYTPKEDVLFINEYGKPYFHNILTSKKTFF